MKFKKRHLTVLIAVFLIIILLLFYTSITEKNGLKVLGTEITQDSYPDPFGGRVNATYYYLKVALINLEDERISTSYIHYSLVLKDDSVVEANVMPIYDSEIPFYLNNGEKIHYELIFLINDLSNLPKKIIYEYNGVKYQADLDGEIDSASITPFIIFGFIAIILFITVVIWTIDVKKVKKKKVTLRCPSCDKTIEGEDKLFCKSWKTRSRICDVGPFCSKKCLKKHLETSDHEHVLGI